MYMLTYELRKSVNGLKESSVWIERGVSNPIFRAVSLNPLNDFDDICTKSYKCVCVFFCTLKYDFENISPKSKKQRFA